MKTVLRIAATYLERTGPLRWRVPLIFVLIALSGLIQALMPRASGWLLDVIVADPGGFLQRWLVWALIAILVLTLVYAVVDYGQKISLTLVTAEVRRRFMRDLYIQLLSLDEAFYLRSRAGDISSRLTKDVSEGVEPLLYSCAQMCFSVVMGTVAIVVLFEVQWVLGVAYLGLLPLWFVYARYVLARTYHLDRSLKEEFGRLNARATEDVGNQALIRIFAKEEERGAIFRDAATTYRDRAIRLGRFTTGATSVQVALLEFVFPLGVLLLCVAFAGQDFTAGDLLAAFGTWIAAGMPVKMVLFHGPRFVSCATSLKRVYEFFDERPLVEDADGAQPLQVAGGGITFEHVTFAYPHISGPGAGDQAPVLEDIDLTVPPGTSCALVGTSGSGKSTLVNLLLRFYDPDAGRVVIDGQDLRHISQHSLRRNLGVVQQDSLLWAGTIRDNLRFVAPDATDEELWAALEHALLASFVRRTPDGLDTLLGEKGVRLSGGQRQRLALARLFLLAPPIVVLDEATSALDGPAERAVQAAMADLLQGRTAVVVAHRLSTIIDCDQIVVMRDGRIVDRGTHSELRRRCAYYDELCTQQGVAA